MTYLDSEASTHSPRWGRLIWRALAIIALLAVGWYTLTLGTSEPTDRPDIVSEPGATLQ